MTLVWVADDRCLDFVFCGHSRWRYDRMRFWLNFWFMLVCGGFRLVLEVWFLLVFKKYGVCIFILGVPPIYGFLCFVVSVLPVLVRLVQGLVINKFCCSKQKKWSTKNESEVCAFPTSFISCYSPPFYIENCTLLSIKTKIWFILKFERSLLFSIKFHQTLHFIFLSPKISSRVS